MTRKRVPDLDYHTKPTHNLKVSRETMLGFHNPSRPNWKKMVFFHDWTKGVGKKLFSANSSHVIRSRNGCPKFSPTVIRGQPTYLHLPKRGGLLLVTFWFMLFHR